MNKAQIYMLIKNEFREKKARAEDLAFELLQKAKRDPAFLELFKKERELTFDIAKCKSKGFDVSSLQDELKSTIILKSKRLQALGIDENHLIPQYSCKKCNDSGLNIKGKPCECFSKSLKQKLIEESSQNLTNLPTFDLFNEKIAKTTEHQTQLSKLKKFMQSWVDNNSTDKQHLICISGDTGVGKSYLTECTATYALKKGYLVSLLTAFSMNNLFLKYLSFNNEEKITAFDSLMDPDLLVIDDLGAEPLINNVTVEYLYLIISERLNNKKETIITTNLDGRGILERYGDRIFSRIFNKKDCFTAKIIGSDLRINK